jgi:dsDNA-specific endonuclease/ATPase MutS2
MTKKSKGINEIDLHGIRHKEAMEMVKDFLNEKEMEGSFSITIITGNSTVLQKRIFKEILELSLYNYYIPSWNLGQIIVDYVKL